MSAWEALGKSNDWYTPRYIFDALDCAFDLDVAHPRSRTHVPCCDFLCVDSLARTWRGFVWMNPPFGGRNGIALVPDRTSAPWFQEAARKANALLFISPKVKFERPDGSLGKSPGCGTVLMSAGSRGRSALFRGGSLGFVALPNLGAEGQADERDGAFRVIAKRNSPTSTPPKE